jgi:N-acyl-D-amino-acid deacylase
MSLPRLARTTRAGVLAGVIALATTAAGPLGAQEGGVHFDLILRGGRVLDGTGTPWIRADIGIRDGRISAVGLLPDASADRVVDVTGRVVAPGFIDIHSHADDNTRGPNIRDEDARRKAAPNLVAQGITTVVVNQDGRSPWPIRGQREALEEGGMGPNVMLMVGHGEVRRQVMGQDVQRPATPAEVDRMRALVRQALDEGAVGMSAGLEYNPGRWSTLDEVAALVEELLPFDGVYISHERSEGTDPMWYWPSRDAPAPPTLLDAVEETIEIGRRTGAKVVASHIKAKGAHYWGSSHAAIQLIERARDEGVRIWADQYPYATSGSDGNTVLIPGWALARRDGETFADALERTLSDREQAGNLRRDIAHEIRRRGGPERVVIFDHPDSALVGRSLKEVAAERGTNEVEMALRLQLDGDPERAGGGRLRGFSLSEDDVEAYGARNWVATATDGGIALPTDGPVHARFYGTFPRKLAHYARDRGVLSMEDAVRSSTWLPAQILGLKDRGMILEGFVADLVVFHPDEIRDTSDFFDPHQYPEGIDHVLVNGAFVVENGALTWALPGKVIPSNRGGFVRPTTN